MIMTTPSFYEETVEDGLLPPDAFERAVTRILTLKFELGLFQNPRLPDHPRTDEVVGSHQDLNLEVARESLVLLENDGTLPLSTPRKVAVIGTVANGV
ncbi:MAG: hypothetical protein WAS54_06950 [Scrofimicrobium sp.]